MVSSHIAKKQAEEEESRSQGAAFKAPTSTPTEKPVFKSSAPAFGRSSVAHSAPRNFGGVGVSGGTAAAGGAAAIAGAALAVASAVNDEPEEEAGEEVDQAPEEEAAVSSLIVLRHEMSLCLIF